MSIAFSLRHTYYNHTYCGCVSHYRILCRSCAVVTARNEVGTRLRFYTCLWFCSRRWRWGGGGGIPACLAAGIQGVGDGISACVAGFQAHTQGGSWRVWLEGVSQSTTQGGSWGVWPGGSPIPHPGGFSRPTTWGGLQAHNQGGVSQHALRQTPPTATAVGSTHPTGMHSCLNFLFSQLYGLHTSTRVKFHDSFCVFHAFFQAQELLFFQCIHLNKIDLACLSRSAT